MISIENNIQKTTFMKKQAQLMFLLCCGLCFGQVERIEPPNWWVAELELLVYGKQIAEMQPEFSQGAQIKKVTKVESPNYLSLTVETGTVTPGTAKLSFKRGNKTVETVDLVLYSSDPPGSSTCRAALAVPAPTEHFERRATDHPKTIADTQQEDQQNDSGQDHHKGKQGGDKSGLEKGPGEQ